MIQFPSILAKDFTADENRRLLALKWSIDRGAESFGNTRPLKTVMAEAEGFYQFLCGDSQ